MSMGLERAQPSPLKIEGIRDVAVFGLPDERMGARTIMLVEGLPKLGNGKVDTAARKAMALSVAA